MAALLVAMSVMAVIMGALLPVWTTLATREKEAELVFRGNQYVRAIGLFQRKFANTNPPTIDLLVQQRFLRKKFKDPITNDDFQPIFANQALQGVSAPAGAQRPGQQASASLSTPAQQTLQSGFGSTAAGAAGGIIGVTSKSKETSLRLYNGRSKYNEWAFIYIQTAQRPGGPGAAVPGQGIPGQGGIRQGPGGPGGFGGPGQGQQPGPFGMQPGAFGNPGQRGPGGGMGGPGGGPYTPGGGQFPGGGPQPSRPPVNFPGQAPQPVRPPG
jgi:hypothetical protein